MIVAVDLYRLKRDSLGEMYAASIGDGGAIFYFGFTSTNNFYYFCGSQGFTTTSTHTETAWVHW
jgi:hypothetical protein